MLCSSPPPPLPSSPIIHNKQPHRHKTQPAQTRKRPADPQCINDALQERDRDGGQGAADHVAGGVGRGGGSLVLVYEEGVVDLKLLGSWGQLLFMRF